jgi:hexosaminidase
MKKSFSLLTIALFYGLIAPGLHAQSLPLNRYNIIPYPALLVPAKGSFIINNETVLIVAPARSKFVNERSFLVRVIKSYLGPAALRLKKTAKKNAIILKYDPSIAAHEAYSLVITPNLIKLSAKEPAGMFYAMETLQQLLPGNLKRDKYRALSIPAVSIQDRSAFPWRGMELDVSRHFFPIEYLEKFVDMMALYKLNKLHLHLTDDQGWRIEIKKYPELSLRGGWRTFNDNDSACMKIATEAGNQNFNLDAKHIIHKNGQTLYGGFYTQDELSVFIRYAAQRHVEIIPEIDMPGHMMAAVKIYPGLACDSTASGGYGFSNPICPCNEKVLAFAKDVFSEVISLFPSKYIHIGGDEVDKINWGKSPVCQEFMRMKGFKNTDQLQSYFNDYMMNFFQSKGKILVGWDEIIKGGIDSAAVVMFWRPWAKESPLEATMNHNKVVMSPDGPLYFDGIPDNKTLYNVYHYDPFDPVYGMNKDEEGRILGVQANLWSEMVPSEKRADYMVMPRMTALAELGWTHRLLYDSYLQRLNTQYARWDNLNINYRLPDLEGIVTNNVFIGQKTFFISSPLPRFSIHYTTDGSLPVITSPVLSKPVIINHTLTIKLALFTPGGRRGDINTLNFDSQQYAQPETAALVKDGLSCALYKRYFDSTAKIKGAPDSSFSVTQVSVPASIKARSFGLKFRGYINVPETGIYNFFLNCNSGGALYIAGKSLIDNDGSHPDKEKSGQIALQSGLHFFDLNFREAGGGYVLDLKYSIGNGKKKVIPVSWFKYNQ